MRQIYALLANNQNALIKETLSEFSLTPFSARITPAQQYATIEIEKSSRDIANFFQSLGDERKKVVTLQRTRCMRRYVAAL